MTNKTQAVSRGTLYYDVSLGLNYRKWCFTYIRSTCLLEYVAILIGEIPCWLSLKNKSWRIFRAFLIINLSLEQTRLANKLIHLKEAWVSLRQRMTSPAQMVYQRRENTPKTQSRLILVLFTDWSEKQQVCFHWFKRIQILAKLKVSRVFLWVVQKVIENILSKTCSTLYCKKRFEFDT